MSRRLDIDWLRGIAVVLMILWHAIDSWTVQGGRDTLAFTAIIFLAGWVAPLFLFLAGVVIPLAGTSRTRRGASARDASWALQKRGWLVFALAHLFRFQSFLLNPNGSWNAVLKPDILNVLGLGMVAAAACWGRSRRSSVSAAGWLLLPSLVTVLVVTPWSRMWWWPTLLHPRLEAYIRPVGNFGVFSLFPAVSFIFAGAFLGALIAGRKERDAAFYRTAAFAGLATLGAGVLLALTPWSANRWVGPFSVFLWRTGAMALAVALSWAFFERRTVGQWNPFVVFGQTSLFVYWVHVEIAYGVFSYPLRHALTLPWSLAAYLLFTLLMFGGAVLWLRRPTGPLVPIHMVSSAGLQGSTVSGVRLIFASKNRTDLQGSFRVDSRR